MPAKSGFVGIDSASIDQVAADIRDVERRIATEDRRANREVADKATGWVRAGASSKLERRFASALRPRATAKIARVAVVATGRNAGANVAFFGMARRTGWNARNVSSRPQGPPPVGNSWVAGRPGEGPYVFRDVIPGRVDDIAREYEDARMRAFSKAFPQGG